MYKMNAKAYLGQIKKMDKIIENKMAEAECWRNIAAGVTISNDERVQSSGNKQRMETAVCRYIDIQAEIDVCIDRLVAKKQEIIRLLEQLTSPEEYDLLHKIYVQQMTFQDVANKYERSYSWVTTIHGRALANLQRILDKKG